MAILYADGFDLYANVADVLRSGWVRNNSSCDFSTSNGRFGGGCLTISSGTSSPGYLIGCNLAQGSTVIIAFAYFHSGTTTVSDLIRGERDGDTAQTLFRIECSASGALTLRNAAGTILETSGNVVTPGGWHWIEAKVAIGTNSSTGAAEVRVNGSTVINQTGEDFEQASGNYLAQIFFKGPNGSSSDVRIDDVIIMDGTGSFMNDFIGDKRIETLIPDGDGGTVNWTASAGSDFQCVDDTPNAANDDTDYISSATAAQESRFTLTALSNTPATVSAVQVRARARKDNAGPRTFRGLINSNANEELGPTQGLSSTYHWMRNGAFYQNPDGDVDWDGTSVNALQAGVEIVA